MTSTLEGQITQLVAEIVRQTEQRVERAFAAAIVRELQARRNGRAARR